MNTHSSRRRREERISSSETNVGDARSLQASDSQQQIPAFPDPWLFDTQELLTALASIREAIWRIPMASHAVHLATQAAADQNWRLEQHLRFLLQLQREGQRAFAKKAPFAHPPVKQPIRVQGRQAQA